MSGFFTKNLAFYRLFCGLQIRQKCFGGRGSAPDFTGEAHDAPPDLLVRSERKGVGGKGPWLPKPWIKKLKLSCRVTHIDVLAVAVINDHKTAHSSFALFQAYDNTKKCSASGASPPDLLAMGSAPGPLWGHSSQTPVIGSRSVVAIWVYRVHQ